MDVTLEPQDRTRDQAPTGEAPARAPLLSVQGLRIDFDAPHGTVHAVDGVSWDVAPGEVVALVGESGCGKSATALSVLRLLARPAGRIAGGRIEFEGRDLVALPDAEMRRLRGGSIGMVFQEPMTSLNPVLTIERQLTEPLVQHLGMSERTAAKRAAELLAEVGLSDAERRLQQFPHELSGGQRQRVMIAMALACRPKLLIADEPTTALDVTVQAQILELMRSLAQRHQIALVLITHNLGVVARHADRVHVMYAGRIVESAPVDSLFAAPRHPYTIGLLAAVPRLDRPRRSRMATIDGLPPDLAHPPNGCRFAARCPHRQPVCDTDPALRPLGRSIVACHRAEEIAGPAAARDASATIETLAPEPATDPATDATTPLLDAKHLHKRFVLGDGRVLEAVRDVSLHLAPGETLGLAGESGCGKTTVGRMILQLTAASAGSVHFDGVALAAATPRPAAQRRRMQVVFQDPYSALNPRMTVGALLAEPLAVHRLVEKSAIPGRVAELIAQVGLSAATAARYPHQLSGGQRQRVGIARALALEPSFIVLDEPVSALDVCVQGQIVNLLADLQRQLGIAYLFIAHDLAVVRHLSHRVMVMYLGRVMEVASRDALYDAPLHPYTIALLEAAPVPDPVRERSRPHRTIAGDPPSPLAPPAGCVFHTRCPRASDECTRTVPALREVRPGRHVACIKVLA